MYGFLYFTYHTLAYIMHFGENMKKVWILNLLEVLSITALVVWIFMLVKFVCYDFNLEKELGSLPAACIKELDGWEIEQVSYEVMSDEYNGDDALASKTFIGLTVVDDKKIYLSGLDYEAHKALAHEIGHVCDVNNGFPSKSLIFEEIYEAEAKGYGATNPQEFFAEVYKDLALGHPSKRTARANEYISVYFGVD